MSKFAVLIAAIAATLVNAQNAVEVAEIQVLVNDINSNLAQYLSLETNPDSGFQIPDNLLSLYRNVATYTDDSFSTLLSGVNFDEITSTIVGLPWYSSRLLPALESASSAAAGSGDAAAAPASANASSVSAAVTSLSSAINSTSSASASATGAVVTSANLTSVSANSTRSGSRSATRSASATGGVAGGNRTNGSTNGTKTSSTKSKNGVAKVEADLAGALLAGAAAMLL